MDDLLDVFNLYPTIDKGIQHIVKIFRNYISNRKRELLVDEESFPITS